MLTQSEELGEGGTLLSDAMYATTPTLSFAVMFRVTLVDVVDAVPLSIVKLPVGACSSMKDSEGGMCEKKRNQGTIRDRLWR